MGKKSPYGAIIETYNMIKASEASDLKDLWLELIDERIKCYSETSDYSLRLNNCRKYYIFKILITAREQIKSAPSIGAFMRCVRDCPLAFSLCNGELAVEAIEADCRDIEALCVEVCLDKYWRGNTLEDFSE
ncbi:hypothetical protein [Desulfamplus magnetovallimortis]|nr:hypothetical protein [Desulfamplus magnetovallimortis]